MKHKITLGIIRLDYKYPPIIGDIDHPDSYNYDVVYRVIPGFTFQMCQQGLLTKKVKKHFINGIKWLDETQQVDAISGDCGFMMYFQELARKYTQKPIFMSSLILLPTIISAYNKTEQIVIFTANYSTLEPMRDLIRKECGINTGEKRFIIIGCQDIPGFDAVAKGEKVNSKLVLPAIVERAKQFVEYYKDVRDILLECTELPFYEDSI